VLPRRSRIKVPASGPIMWTPSTRSVETSDLDKPFRLAVRTSPRVGAKREIVDAIGDSRRFQLFWAGSLAFGLCAGSWFYLALRIYHEVGQSASMRPGFGRHGDCDQACPAIWLSGLRREPRQRPQLHSLTLRNGCTSPSPRDAAYVAMLQFSRSEPSPAPQRAGCSTSASTL
jgi:hypothetical protein